MKGKYRVYSVVHKLNDYTYQKETVIDLCIQYNDGQIIRTEISLDGLTTDYKLIHEVVCKYFKGDLHIG